MPYEADISAALRRLREDVFTRGDYLSDDGLTDEERNAILEEARPGLDAWMEKVREEAAKLEEPFRTKYLEGAEKHKQQIMGSGSTSPNPRPKPTTIEELLESRAESGTHSILDIHSISSEPQFGAISPFPRTKLVEFFGTETPTHEQIEEVHDSGSLEEYVSERWQGVYIVAYRNGLPSEIFFAGCSGD